MKKSQILTAGTLIALSLLPIGVFAKTLDPAYRSCMQQAVRQREVSTIASVRQYNDEIENALEVRRQRLEESWNQADSRDQRDQERQAERDYRDTKRDSQRNARERERDIGHTFSDMRRDCRDVSRNSNSSSSSSRTSGGSTFRCRSNNECGAGRICTTSYGVCDSACDPGEICTEVCTGRCVSQ